MALSKREEYELAERVLADVERISNLINVNIVVNAPCSDATRQFLSEVSRDNAVLRECVRDFLVAVATKRFEDAERAAVEEARELLNAFEKRAYTRFLKTELAEAEAEVESAARAAESGAG